MDIICMYEMMISNDKLVSTWIYSFLKVDLKIKNIDIHLYFIATKYLWNKALVEYKDN